MIFGLVANLKKFRLRDGVRVLISELDLNAIDPGLELWFQLTEEDEDRLIRRHIHLHFVGVVHLPSQIIDEVRHWQSPPSGCRRFPSTQREQGNGQSPSQRCGWLS